jgi:hypothetical protein
VCFKSTCLFPPPCVRTSEATVVSRVTLLLPFTRQKIFRNPSQTFRRVFQSHVLVPPSVSVPRRPQSYRVTNSYSLPFKRFLGPLTNHPPCVSNPRACPPPCVRTSEATVVSRDFLLPLTFQKIFRTPHKPSAVCFKSTCLFSPPCVRTSEATVVSRDFLLPFTFQKIFRTLTNLPPCVSNPRVYSPPLVSVPRRPQSYRVTFSYRLPVKRFLGTPHKPSAVCFKSTCIPHSPYIGGQLLFCLLILTVYLSKDF